MSDHPWLKFYPRDWRGDQALRAVTISARGLWVEMLCIMHEAQPYGYLLLGGNPVDAERLSRMAGLPENQCADLLGELEGAGVFSRDRRGWIYSRRMIADKKRAEIGRKSVSKRYAQAAGKKGEKHGPNRSDDSPPSPTSITQKPEARDQSSKSDAPNGASARAWSKPPCDVDLQIWADLKANRKRKRLSNTETAYKRLQADLTRVAGETGWTPAKLLEHAAGRGWGAIFAPDEWKRSKANGRQDPGYSRTTAAAERAFGPLDELSDERSF